MESLFRKDIDKILNIVDRAKEKQDYFIIKKSFWQSLNAHQQNLLEMNFKKVYDVEDEYMENAPAMIVKHEFFDNYLNGGMF